MAWEQSKDFTTGYLTEWTDSARWRAKVTQEGIGGTRWRWSVTKQRDTAGPCGEWWDEVATDTADTRQDARARASLILRASVMTKTRARKLARKSTAHGYYVDAQRASAYCCQCRKRIDRETFVVEVGADGKTMTRSKLTQLHDALAEHLIHSCEYVLPEREVKLILEGRHS